MSRTLARAAALEPPAPSRAIPAASAVRSRRAGRSRPRPAAAATPVAQPHSTFGAAVRALPDHRLLDTLLRSRAWIWLLGIALGGIVFMQVSLLGMNAGIGRAVAEVDDARSTTTPRCEEHDRRALRAATASAPGRPLGLISPDAGRRRLPHRPRRARRPPRRRPHLHRPSDAARQALATVGRHPAAVDDRRRGHDDHDHGATRPRRPLPWPPRAGHRPRPHPSPTAAAPVATAAPPVATTAPTTTPPPARPPHPPRPRCA